MARQKINPYLFDQNEEIILKLIDKHTTPLQISKNSKLPRATVYFALEKLKRRGIIEKYKKGKKFFWRIKNFDLLNRHRDSTNNIVKFTNNKKEIFNFINKAFLKDNIRLRFFNGDNIIKGWNKNVGHKNISDFNNKLRDQKIVSDIISSEKSIEKQASIWGESWKQHFLDRPIEYHFMDEEFLNHGAQIIIRDDCFYLINMNIPMIIEIKDTEIQKMFLSIFEFIKKHTNRRFRG